MFTVGRLLIFGALALLTFGLPASAQDRVSCGDVTADSSIDIADLTYLITYLRGNGPAPPDPTSANMDLCDSVDIGDLAYLVEYIFEGGAEPCADPADCTPYPGGHVYVGGVDGETWPGYLPTGQLITFYLRFSNSLSDSIRHLSNGFRVYSPDGAQWSSTTIDTIPGFMDTVFIGLYGDVHNGDGVGADTVGLLGFSIYPWNGMPPGFNDTLAKITIGPLDTTDIGKTICLDTAFFGPAGNWKWQVDGQTHYTPSWGGPYCFTIGPGPDAAITLDHVDGIFDDTALIANVPVRFHLRGVHNLPDPVVGVLNGYRVYSPDGAHWDTTYADTSGSLFANYLDGGFFINQFNCDGFGSDTIGLGGFAMFDPGVPSGFDDWIYSINIGPIDPNDVGRYICLDSAHYPPNNPSWLWNTPVEAAYPEWYGPYCYTIVDISFWLEVAPDSLAFQAEVGGPDPAAQVIFIDEASGYDIEYTLSDTTSWLNLDKVGGTTPDSVVVSVDVNGLGQGVYHSDITITAPAAVEPVVRVPIVLTMTQTGEPADSLIIPSVTVDDVCGAIQPVAVKLMQPIKGASIPIEIPDGVTITELSFEGLVTESWDYSFTEINSSQGYAFVALANSQGLTIPPGSTTVFNMVFNAGTAECLVPSTMRWDTTLMDDPAHALLFSDINNLDLLPGFYKYRDQTTIPGYQPGDFDGGGACNVVDLTLLVEYLFNYGPPPCVLEAMDVNGTCTGPNIADLTYIVDYLFQEGNAPVCGCIGTGLASPKVNPDIEIRAVTAGDVTTLILASPVSIRGVQLELKTASQVPVSHLLSESFDLLGGSDGSTMRIGLVDMNGVAVLDAGEHKLIEIPGDCEIVSAVVSDRGHQDIVPAVVSRPSGLPAEFALYQNYPNPFNPTTNIVFYLGRAGHATLEVYNALGQKVATLVDGPISEGEHTVTWNATGLASGIYAYKLKAGGFLDTKKMLLLK